MRLRRRGLELHLTIVTIALFISVVPGSVGELARDVLSGRDLIVAGAIVLIVAAVVWMIWPGRWLALVDFFSLFWVVLSLGELVRRRDLPGHVIPLDDRLLAAGMLIALWLSIGLAAAVLWAGPVARDGNRDSDRTTDTE